jgi:glyoxylase-like metal-dependent hydrolase (beta-lactamase superfamily II)
MVSSYALVDESDRLLLFDPLAVPSEIEGLAAGRETAVVLTAPWHERDARLLVEQHEWPLFAPPRETEDDFVAKGFTREQAAGGSPDLRWLVAADTVDYHSLAAGERLPGGVEVFPARSKHEVVLWIESGRAVVAGDALADLGNGLEINAWPGEGAREQLAEALRPLLALPVEVVLPAHGVPADRAALERALS